MQNLSRRKELQREKNMTAKLKDGAFQRWVVAGNTKECRRGSRNEGNNQRPTRREHGLKVGLRLSVQFSSIGVSTKNHREIFGVVLKNL